MKRTKRTTSIAELKEGSEKKYGKGGWIANLKFLITEVLEKEREGKKGGDFSFIMKKLREEKGLASSDVLRNQVSLVLRNWNKELKEDERRLKKDKKGISNGRVKRYSLE